MRPGDLIKINFSLQIGETKPALVVEVADAFVRVLLEGEMRWVAKCFVVIDETG